MCACISNSLRIDGDIEGFEVHLDDVQLRTLLKVPISEPVTHTLSLCLLQIVSTLKLPPPALANTTTYYNELPVSFVNNKNDSVY